MDRHRYQVSCLRDYRVIKSLSKINNLVTGKTVTVITGLDLTAAEAKTLLKKLKIRCGTGGTLKEGIMELQGDQVKTSMEFLAKEGFSPRQSGG